MCREGGYPAPTAPKFGGQTASMFLRFDERVRVVCRVNLNEVVEAVSTDQIQSIIQSGAPRLVSIRRHHHGDGVKAIVIVLERDERSVPQGSRPAAAPN